MIKNLYNKLTELKRDKSAFTIIELLVIIAVLAILVLLAIPRFMGQIDKSRVAQITNDIAVVERKVSEQMIGGLKISEWDSVSESELSFLETEEKLYNKKGQIDSENTRESAEGSIHIAPNEFVKSETGSKLEGSFIVGEGGDVHYSEDELEGTPPREEISDDYEVAQDAHFTWVADKAEKPKAPYSEMRGEYGYYLYTGGEEYVIIPEKIYEERVTNYFKMFSADSSGTVKGVASKSKYITDMNRMFEGFPSMELEVTHLDTDNVQHMSSMFKSTNIEELDITYFNTSNVINMPEMFANSNINTLELGKMELNNVESMYGMFMATNADKVDLARLSAPKLKNFNQMFKGANITNVYMNSFKAPVGNSMYGAFRDMEATSVNLSNAEISKEFNIEDVPSWEKPNINQWFASSNIKELNVSNLKAYNIYDAYGFFLRLESDNVNASELYIQGSEKFTEFFGWANITGEVNLNNANFPNARDLYGMFGDISADKVSLENFSIAEDTTGYSSYNLQMNRAFIRASIRELNMVNVKLNNIKDINQMFLDAEIKTINIKNLDGPNLYHMHGVFQNVKADKINIDGFRVSHEHGGYGYDAYEHVRLSNLFFKSEVGVLSIKNLDAPNSIQNHGLFKESKIVEVSLVDINIGSADWIIEHQNNDDSYYKDSRYTLNMMFANSVIGKLKFDNFKAPYMRDYHGLFKEAKIGEVDLSGLDTSGASRMPEMFQKAVIESVDLSSLDTSNVETMGSMFSGSTMKELDLRSFDTSKVEDMGAMFDGAAATQINISSFRNKRLNHSLKIFANTQFEEIDLSNFDIIGVSIGINAFKNAKAKRVYVSSQEIVDKFNAYTVEEGKPEQLTFYVK